MQGKGQSAGSSAGGRALDVQRYEAIGDFGDHDLIISGLHENFRSARYLDTHMARTASILENLADGDRLLGRAQRCSDYALLKFAPAHALAIRAIVAGPSRYGFPLTLGSLHALTALHV